MVMPGFSPWKSFTNVRHTSLRPVSAHHQVRYFTLHSALVLTCAGAVPSGALVAPATGTLVCGWQPASAASPESPNAPATAPSKKRLRLILSLNDSPFPICAPPFQLSTSLREAVGSEPR